MEIVIAGMSTAKREFHKQSITMTCPCGFPLKPVNGAAITLLPNIKQLLISGL